MQIKGTGVTHLYAQRTEDCLPHVTRLKYAGTGLCGNLSFNPVWMPDK